jgi:cytidine deaminase
VAADPPDELTWKALQAEAEEARGNAYAPYSRFMVGAALQTAEGRIFAGCNIENASFGLSICAERNAVFSAVSATSGKPEITAIYITNYPPVAAPPCGACRQVLAEFGDPVVSFLSGQSRRTMRLSELLPEAYPSPP